MSEYFEQLRKEKEIIKLRESLKSDWRSEIMEEEEHPYVDVMPSCDQKQKDAEKKVKKKKEEEVVKEQALNEKWTDLFTGDSDAKRARRGEGGGSGKKDGGYNPKTGTSRTDSGRDVIVAPKNGRAGTMVKGNPNSWSPLPTDVDTSKQAMRRYNTLARDNQRVARDAKAGRGGDGSRDYGYDAKTGTSETTSELTGKTDRRIFARKNGKPGYMIKGKPGSWEESDASHGSVRQAARRHD